ncbi:MAG: TetR family transcriptional regulator C-terminal domain-containing protein [Pseudomonadota bacterium]
MADTPDVPSYATVDAANRSAPRFSRLSPEARRQEILLAARRCLARSGVAGFTVAEIAATAGISNGLIGHYFPTKDDLLVATYEAEATRLLVATRAALESNDDSDSDFRLRALVDSAFCPEIFNAETVATWLALWGQVCTNPTLRKAHAEIYAPYRRAFSRAITRAADARGLSLESDAIAFDMSALIDGLWLDWALDPTLFDAAAARASCYRLLAAHGLDLKQD